MAKDRGIFAGVGNAFDIIRRELPQWWVDANRGRYMRPSESVMAPPGMMEMSNDDIVPADVLEFAWETNPADLLTYASDAEGAPKGKLPKSGLMGKLSRLIRPNAVRAGQRIKSGQKAGQFIGAPPGVDTPQALGAFAVESTTT